MLQAAARAADACVEHRHVHTRTLVPETPERLRVQLRHDLRRGRGAARCLRNEKKYDAMIARFRQLIADFPDLPQSTVANANYWIGWGYYKQEKHYDVARYIRKARDLAPEYYSQPAGNILILSAFAQRDKGALHTALQEVFAVAPE